MLLKMYYLLTRMQPRNTAKGTITDLSVILQMLSIYLSCHEAHIPAAHFIQALCNRSLFIAEMVFPQGYKEEVV